MAAAACAAAFMIGAKAYYVLDTRLPDMKNRNPIVELPIPAIPIIKTIDKIQLQILKKLITCNRHMSNRELREVIHISPQKLSYHVKQLSKKGFVSTQRGFDKMTTRGEIVRDTRILDISITNAGRLAANMVII